MALKTLQAEHGVVCRLGGDHFGYFGWPTVARLDDGTLLVVSSGLRTAHVDPWGRTVLNLSQDDGRTWSAPRVINDSPIDDRDAGVVSLGGSRLLVSWFAEDTRPLVDEPQMQEIFGAEAVAGWRVATARWNEGVVQAALGSWVMLSDDSGSTWGRRVRVPVSTPHGPIRLASGDLLYFGKRFRTGSANLTEGAIAALLSRDRGQTWDELGHVPLYPGTAPANYHEPHVVELPSGRLLGMIRVEVGPGAPLPAAMPNFSMAQTASDDGGRTWSEPRPLGFHGSPPHLLRHSSGTLILTYGYRLEPYGQRVAFSHDDGETWDHDWALRDDGPTWDLGYPATVEMPGGSLFSVYYQQFAAGEKPALLWSRWRL